MVFVEIPNVPKGTVFTEQVTYIYIYIYIYIYTHTYLLYKAEKLSVCLSVCLSIRLTVTPVSQQCQHQSKRDLLEMKAESSGTEFASIHPHECVKGSGVSRTSH